jgi:threonine aldolase
MAAEIDLRSDTVTKPTPGMREAMARAEVGDDVYGDDPSVNHLEESLAARAGFEKGLFLPSGTQSNLVALMSHCARGEEYLVGQEAHTYRYEGGGAAVLGSIQPQPLQNSPDGTIDIELLRSAIKPDDCHFAITRLIALENTIGGKVLPPAYVDAVAQLAREHGLGMHLDGARAFNAAIASACPISEICAPYDSVSLCLSKGLGTPAGSVLCGSTAFIERARRWRKMLGGGMRQAGVLAAAGLYALEHHIERLADDHANAKRLADGLRAIPGFKVTAAHTNMVFIDIGAANADEFKSFLKQHGVICTTYQKMRLVTHLGIDQTSIDRVIAVFGEFFQHQPA